MKRTIGLFVVVIFLVACRNRFTVDASPGPVIEPPLKTRMIVGETSAYANVHCGLLDTAGHLWFGTTDRGIFKFDGEFFTNYTTEQGLPDNSISCIMQDTAGLIWFGTGNGACYYNGSAFIRFPILRGGGLVSPDSIVFTSLVENPDMYIAVSAILQDKTGAFWFATNVGIYRYDGKRQVPLLRDADLVNPENLHLTHCMDMLESRDGVIWFASWNNEGAVRYDGQILKSSLGENGLDDDMIFSLLEDRAGNLWMGTRDQGLWHFDGTAFRNVTASNEQLRYEGVYDLIEDSKGNIWLTTQRSGVFFFNPSGTFDSFRFTQFTTANGLVNNSVFCAVEDRDGRIWFGTRATGLCCFDGSSFRKFSD